jgi:hypothetical protein
VFKCLHDIRFFFIPICFVGAHVLIMLFVFIYVYRCQTQFPYQTYVSFTIVTIGATRGTGTTYPSNTSTLIPVMVVIVWDLQIPAQSMPITTKVVSSNPARGIRYKSMCTFGMDLRLIGGLLWAYHRDIADIF